MTRTAVTMVIATLAVTLGASGCATDGQGQRTGMTETGAGALIGGATGAAIGALVASKSAKGALIGAVGGAIAGGMVGSYMEQQRRDFERALRDEIAAGVIRVEPLPNDQLLVGMTGTTAFEVDSDVIQPGFYSTLDKISHIVRRYGKTELAIGGHTDNTGSVGHNQALSERRARSVERRLLADGVIPERLSATGYGLHRPIASNDTEAGRRLNRRVDIVIVPVTAG